MFDVQLFAWYGCERMLKIHIQRGNMEPVSDFTHLISSYIEPSHCVQCKNEEVMNHHVHCISCGAKNVNFSFRSFAAINSNEFSIQIVTVQGIAHECKVSTEHHVMLVSIYHAKDGIFCDRCGQKL